MGLGTHVCCLGEKNDIVFTIWPGPPESFDIVRYCKRCCFCLAVVCFGLPAGRTAAIQRSSVKSTAGSLTSRNRSSSFLMFSSLFPHLASMCCPQPSRICSCDPFDEWGVCAGAYVLKQCWYDLENHYTFNSVPVGSVHTFCQNMSSRFSATRQEGKHTIFQYV